MSTVIVVVPPVMRPFVGGQARVPVSAATVREALEALAGGSDALRDRLFDKTDSINRFIRVFVDGRPVAGEGGEQPVKDGAVVTILLAMAGG